jgi:putative N6-adenine-specific DNA methylase
MVDAPLKETLAAAILAIGGVRDDVPFIDPMCGSGTLAIEHALAARGIAAGLRRRFGFERWPTLPAADLAAFAQARREADAAAIEATKRPLPPIVCADVNPDALAAAQRNASAANVDDVITFERADVAALTPRWPVATLVTNPPYGERLDPPELDRLYRDMARAFEGLSGWRLVVLSGNPAFARALRRKPSVMHRLWNGALETRLLRYDIG